MDTVLTTAISRIAELPLDVQREIGAALLNTSVEPELPVIEFDAE